MKMRIHWNKERLLNWRLPALGPGLRALLYGITILFVVLSIVQAAEEKFIQAVGVACYVMAAASLCLSCCYLVQDIRKGIIERVKGEIESHSLTSRAAKDYRYRTVIFAVFGLIINISFAVFNGVVGIAGRSAWYGTLAAYYILLSILRFTAVREAGILSGKADGEERLPAEIRFYRWCGILFIIMTAALCGTVILILDEEGGKHYPGSLIYGAALYAFYKMIMSVVNLVKVRKHRSPLLLAIRDIGYVDACVSILSLQTAMFASFGTGEKEFSRLMNGVTGAAVCLMVLGTGIRAVWMAGKMKQKWKEI